MGKVDVRDPADVTICIASINTRAALELCIRSLRRHTAPGSCRVVVGDCGSTDGSLPMLVRMLRAGWVDDVEVALRGRRHAGWIDHWVDTCPTRYLVLCDSDVEFRRAGWLEELRSAAQSGGAVLAAAGISTVQPGYVHPVTGEHKRMAPRPTAHLMLLDAGGARRVATSFESHTEDADVPEGRLGYDVGGLFLRECLRTGLPVVAMPPAFEQTFRHWEGMSWTRNLAGRRLRGVSNTTKVAVKLAVYRLVGITTPAGRLRQTG